ncbi:AAA-domain-containing protein [Piedraia hortae CBS 480.64]|uniref:Vesicular-fusion protein SEC18 n=1 Tax=Piedraia hortae CBS 480.64 TaxID=1314780 RepID=A0A6A7C8R5_9PEZI|nr:AAA-domain-containing protein [Piedraia hortae CBS 480.64]
MGTCDVDRSLPHDESSLLHQHTMLTSHVSLVREAIFPWDNVALLRAPVWPTGDGQDANGPPHARRLSTRGSKVGSELDVWDKHASQSEESFRKLVASPEAEHELKGDNSGLHVIHFDEFDAIARSRGGGTSVGSSIVCQLLIKMDGVKQLNILVIGTTSRKALIDETLLRLGLFKVQLETSLPDEAEEQQISDPYD